MDGVTDICHDEEEGKISFMAESYQPFVLMQETFINFPIQGWELRPQGQDSVLYTIRAPLIEFGIKVNVSSKRRLESDLQPFLLFFISFFSGATQ